MKKPARPVATTGSGSVSVLPAGVEANLYLPRLSASIPAFLFVSFGLLSIRLSAYPLIHRFSLVIPV